jgi:hypothetical protein
MADGAQRAASRTASYAASSIVAVSSYERGLHRSSSRGTRGWLESVERVSVLEFVEVMVGTTVFDAFAFPA